MSNLVAQDSALVPSSQRRVAVRTVALEIWSRRQAGEALGDDQVLAQYSLLLPELAEELKRLQMIRLAVLAGRKIPGSLEPIHILSDDELESAIDVPDEPIDDPSDEPRPVIPGYLLRHEIRRGGQATVFEATQESTGQRVAVKVLPRWIASRQRDRFDREVRILASLEHSHIVKIIDRGRTADRAFFLAMEFVDGWELDEYWLEQISHGTEATAALLTLFLQIARAIEEAHARGVLHRDLKPSNIRVDRRGAPHILDFGMARHLEHDPMTVRTITESGQIVGSLPWASPEQARGANDTLNPSSDVYALGVMLYQALTDQFPYPVDGSLGEVLHNIEHFTPRAPSRIAGARTFPPAAALDAIVLKALEKNPERRYGSAGAFADDLERLLAHVPIGAKARRRVGRRVAIFAVALVLASGIASVVAYQLKHSHPAFALPSSSSQSVVPRPAVTNYLQMRLVQLSGGIAVIGSPNDGERYSNTDRRREVFLLPFYTSATEVTQWQYEQVMGENPSDPRWRGPDLPVQNVTYANAMEFCRKLSTKTGQHYRLPSDSEWEYACRASSPTTYSGPSLDAVGWYVGNSGGALHPVAQKSPNAWGLYDMHGGVAEWCSDEISPGSTGDQFEPPKGRRVIRSGSALRPANECRAADRRTVNAGLALPDLGFRVVLDTAAR